MSDDARPLYQFSNCEAGRRSARARGSASPDKGLLDRSMPLGKNLTFQLKPYGDKVREIAGSRVPKINQILKNYQDTSQSYYTLLELIENAYKENVEIFN